ncbi:FecR family protein [Chitinophaga sp. Cy-1792]|uniref:FecR family protein n=1 Tax=Chitinophaga sp. Cy-1792 TaxID=2608339 RepID=UPI00141E495D|nr:FecR family protein [Chitinophaga sp. Cy-1792]NIG57556.1 FecR family protein [Chitinophaga sp. Cy-1792]
MTKEEIISLTEKVAAGTATDAELMQYNRLFDAFQQGSQWDEQLMGDEEAIGQAIRNRLQPMLQPKRSAKVIRWRSWAAAASVVILLGAGGYFLQQRAAKPALAPQIERFKNDIPAPAGNHAVLTLSNGQQVMLDSAGLGMLAVQGKIQVAKGADGVIIYTGSDKNIGNNTVQLPAGSRALAIVLSDGTKAWIDAGSSLTYPVAFTGSKRNVTVSGQVYFEVAQNSNQPFTVFNSSDKTTVEVLGTSFNLRAFATDSSTKVTLVSGSVKVNTTTATHILTPGQQAVTNNKGNISIHNNVDIPSALAWKEGLFYFNGADIATILSEVERYYNVEVVYQANVNDVFVAKIPRDVPVSQLLNLLEMTNLVHFRIEGRKITVIQ